MIFFAVYTLTLLAVGHTLWMGALPRAMPSYSTVQRRYRAVRIRFIAQCAASGLLLVLTVLYLWLLGSAFADLPKSHIPMLCACLFGLALTPRALGRLRHYLRLYRRHL